MNKITFIIPTIGRDTLSNTIKSLEEQTNQNWNAIIIFDGIKKNIINNNDKIKIIEIEKSGKDINSAGNVRNKGMDYVSTEYIAFVDDDDTLANNYVETFYNEINEYPFIDVIIFRMYRSTYNDILPELKTDNFYNSRVGISFIMKKYLFDNGIKFIPSHIEDFNLLDLIRRKNYKIMISPYIRYFVGKIDKNNKDKFTNNSIVGNRLFINNIVEKYMNNNNLYDRNNYILIFLYILLIIILIILIYLFIIKNKNNNKKIKIKIKK